MIQLYTGVPGAGKTYKMVADLDAFLVKEPDINLISNIRDLKLPHLDFDEFLAEHVDDKSLTLPQRIDKFFHYDLQKSLNDHVGGPIMYVLDECQLYFPRRTSLPNTEEYLQRHRHLGHYLYLATQSSKLISSNIVALIEIEFYAVRRSISMFGEMHYRVKSPSSNQIIKMMTVVPKKRIFNLYKSFEVEEITKPKRELWKKLWPLALIAVGAFLFYNRIIAKTSAVDASPPPPVNQTSKAELETIRREALERLTAIQAEVETLQRQLEEAERIILPIVKVGARRLTVDPETHAVVDITRIPHKVICSLDGLSCYYDRPVKRAVKFASDQDLLNLSYGLGSGPVSLIQPGGLGEAGPGSFVSPDLVPSK